MSPPLPPVPSTSSVQSGALTPGHPMPTQVIGTSTPATQATNHVAQQAIHNVGQGVLKGIQGTVTTPKAANNIKMVATPAPDKIQRVFAMRVVGKNYTTLSTTLEQQNKLNEKFHAVKSLLQNDDCKKALGLENDSDISWDSLTIFTDRMMIRYVDGNGKRVEKSLLPLFEQNGPNNSANLDSDKAQQLENALEELDDELRGAIGSKTPRTETLRSQAESRRSRPRQQGPYFRDNSSDLLYRQALANPKMKDSFTLQERVKKLDASGEFDLDQHSNLLPDSIKNTPPAGGHNTAKDKVEERLMIAKDILGNLQRAIKDELTKVNDEQKKILSALSDEFDQIDKFALALALAYYPTDDISNLSEADAQTSLNEAADQLKATLEKQYTAEYKKHSNEVKKQQAWYKPKAWQPQPLQPYDRDYAADVASVVFSGDSDAKRKENLYHSFALAEHQSPRALSLIDAVMKKVIENPGQTINARSCAENIVDEEIKRREASAP